MGTLTLTQLKAELTAGLGNRTDLNTRLTILLNLAQDQLARLHDFDELETTTALSIPYNGVVADRQITITGLRELYALVIHDGTSNSEKLKGFSMRKFVEAIPDNQYLARGTPEIYTIWKDVIEMHPMPNKAYSGLTYYTKWPTAFADGSPNATSDFNNKDDIIIEMALINAYMSLNKLEEATRRINLLQPRLDLALESDRRKPDQDIVPNRNAGLGHMIREYWANPFLRS